METPKATVQIIQRAYKYRIYPNKQQQAFLNKTMGCCRWLWNYALSQFQKIDEENNVLYKALKENEQDKTKLKGLFSEKKKKLSVYDISREIPLLKKKEDTRWLKEAISISLIHTLRNLDTARTSYFRKLNNGEIEKYKKDYIRHRKERGLEVPQGKLFNLGKPRFKSKGHRQSCSFHQAYSIDFKNGIINISKCPNIKAKFHRIFTGKSKTVTIERTPSGKYFASILVEEEMLIPEIHPIEEATTIGIHNGLNKGITQDDEEVIHITKHLRANLKRLKVLSKRLSKKQEKSKRWDKQRIRIAKLHEDIVNRRNYLLHAIANKIIKNPKYNTIALENWDKKEMMNNPIFAQAIADVSWEKLIMYIKYKAIWNGKNIIELKPAAPNAKTCNDCGHINEWVKLKDRVWDCEKCGKQHIREENASKNTKKMALKEFNINA